MSALDYYQQSTAPAKVLVRSTVLAGGAETKQAAAITNKQAYLITGFDYSFRGPVVTAGTAEIQGNGVQEFPEEILADAIAPSHVNFGRAIQLAAGVRAGMAMPALGVQYSYVLRGLVVDLP